MKKILLLFLFFCPIIAPQAIIDEEYQYDLYRARVLEVEEKVIIENGERHVRQEAKIEIINRDYRGTKTSITNHLTGDIHYDMPLQEGTIISVHQENDSFYFVGYDNTNALILLILVFLGCIVLIGGIKGLKSLLALSVTLSIIVLVMIPMLLQGINPILASIFVCTIATIITFFIIAGINRKTIAATLGTSGGLILGGLIAYVFGILARLSGFSSPDASMLLYLPGAPTFDYRGLLFAGIIIGALGAAMDVAISIASSLTELKKENPNISNKNMIKAGFNIGRDIMGTMINTLVLAYVGSAITMLLLLVGFGTSLFHLINLDFFATEVVRAIAGSVGLLFAIPLTIMAFVMLPWKQEGGKHETD